MSPFCKECQTAGLKQGRIYTEGGSVTCMDWTPYWEEGVYHSHDPNKHEEGYSCSNGHTWVESRYASCPAKDYPKEKP